MARLTLPALLAVPWLLLSRPVLGDAVLDLQNQGRPNLDARIAKSATCTPDKLQVRREWCVRGDPVPKQTETVCMLTRAFPQG